MVSGGGASPEDTTSDGAAYDLPELPSFKDLDSGSFIYTVVGADVDMEIDGGTVQDQSTPAEYVIGLVDDSTRYSLTLFIPLDVAAGKIPLKPYNKASPTKGPGTAIYIGMWLYHGTEGIMIVDSVKDNKVTGQFSFTAVHESDPSKVITVTGAFKDLPLVKKFT